MPYPKKGESRGMFVSRAIKEFRKEGIPQKEAVGRAYGFFKTYHGKKKKGMFKK